MFEVVTAVVLPVTLLAWVAGALHAARGGPDPGLGWFCFQHAIPDSVGARSLVRDYLVRTRIWRAVGAGAGVVVPIAVVVFTDVRPPVAVSLCIGWLAAGMAAEITGRRRRHGIAMAPLWSVTDLVSPATRHTIAATAATAVAMIASAATLRTSPQLVDAGTALPDPARLVVVTLGSLTLAAVLWRGLRAIGLAPFPVSETDLDVAEHAIRVASAVRLVAGWAALQLVLAGWLAWQSSGTARSPFGWMLAALAVACFVGAGAAWWWMPTRLAHRRTGDHAIA